ncbi:MAG TPA: TonB family protein [Sphingomicrobium sp.]
MIARVLAIIAVALSTTATDAPEIRQPTGKWVVNFAESQCILSRDYGTPDKPFALIFEPSAMGDRISLIVLRPGKFDDLAKQPAKLRFEPLRLVIETDAFAYGVQSKELVRINFTIEREHLERTLDAKSITINGRRLVNVGFSVPGFRSAWKVLDACRADLLATWGIPVKLQARFKTPAKPLKETLGAYFTSDDYPSAALNKGEEGRVRSRMLVETSGAVSKCDVISSSGSKALDDVTCKIILKRVRYSPALDIDGKPMRSIEIADVSFVGA